MQRFAIFLAARPLWAGGCLLGLLVLASGGWRSEAPRSSWTDDPSWDLAAETEDSFGLGLAAGWIALLGDVEGDQQALEVLGAVEAAIEALPWIGQVLTPLDLPGAVYASGLDTLEHPLAGPLFASQRGYLLPMLWDPQGARDLPKDHDERVEEAARIALASVHGRSEWEAGVTGPHQVFDAQFRAFRSERLVYTLGGTLLVFLLASAVFRNVRAVFLSGLGPLLGVVIGVGIARRLGLAPSGFTAVVLPLLTLTIGFTDSLHLVLSAARIHRESQGRLTPGAAATQAVGDLVLPCALTSLTTAIGFGSMALAGNEVIARFGASCAFATLLAFLCILLAFPCLAHTPLGHALERLRLPKETASYIGRPLRYILARPRRVACMASLLTAALVLVTIQLRVDERLIDDLARGSDAGRLMARCDDEFGGLFPLQVRIDWDSGTPLREVWAAATAARDALNAEPDLAPAVSVVDAVQGLSPVGRVWGGFMGGVIFASLPSPWRRPFIDLDARATLVHTRIPDVGSAASKRIFASIRERLAAQSRPGLRLSLVGTRLAHIETSDGVARELGQSLALAALLILATLGIAFRSLRMALASAIPNILPVAAAAAGLVWLGGGAKLSTLTALTLALGIAADDTIHVLARWRSARQEGLAPTAAAEVAVQRTLPALTMTTVNLTVAFGLLATSSIPTIVSFGLLVAITLVVAFLSDVFLLPPLLVALAKD